MKRIDYALRVSVNRLFDDVDTLYYYYPHNNQYNVYMRFMNNELYPPIVLCEDGCEYDKVKDIK